MKSTREAIDSLEANRSVMRGLLMPRAAQAANVNAFPRSAAMRFLLDGRKRQLAFGAVTAALMFMRRRRRSHWL